jgi:hypothetical protein
MATSDKGLGMLLVGEPKEGEEEEGSSEHSDDLKLVAHELLDAISDRDVEGVCSALKAAVACVERDGHSEDEE